MSVETEDKCPCVYDKAFLLTLQEMPKRDAVLEALRISAQTCAECMRAKVNEHEIASKIAQAIKLGHFPVPRSYS